jgi:hypothetical protein
MNCQMKQDVAWYPAGLRVQAGGETAVGQVCSESDVFYVFCYLWIRVLCVCCVYWNVRGFFCPSAFASSPLDG